MRDVTRLVDCGVSVEAQGRAVSMTAIAAAILALSMMPVAVQGQTGAASANIQTLPMTADGKPDLRGIWQVLNAAAWDIQDHVSQAGVPAGQGVVDGNEIPYLPWAAARKKENYTNRFTADPERNCFLPGVPRATYMPFPFQIVQTPRYVAIAYEYAHAYRTIYTDGSTHRNVVDFWMGDSRGHWEGNTLVVDVTSFNDETWFDRAGNFHSDALHVVERYALIDTNTINFEATIEDPKVFTRPWKMSMPLYRRRDKNVQLLEYECVAHLEDGRKNVK